MIADLPVRPLEAGFFARDTLTVSRELLGARLMRFWPETGTWLACPIVETEAYTADDPACHAYKKTTGRAEVLFGPPGTAYVYLIYGMYDCLNVVTELQGQAGAVLFRAVAPPLSMMPEGAVFKTNGPGRLTRALQITRQEFNGQPLTRTESGLYLAAGESVPESNVIQTTRIGITKATEYPWRFYVADSPWVSVKDKSQKCIPTNR